jgi:hypothetical protein
MKLRAHAIVGAALMASIPLGASVADTSAFGPEFEVDAAWPKDLPNNWLVGQVGGIAVDRYDNIWILQRARTLTSD